MSYRSDLDAALARIDALEQENARLLAESGALRTAAPSDRGMNALLIGLIVVFMATFVAVAALLDRSVEEPPPESARYVRDVTSQQFLDFESAEWELIEVVDKIHAHYVELGTADALVWQPYTTAVTRRNEALEHWVHAQ